MGNRRNLQVITYDISDDRRRRRIARLLEEVGTRVQFSVFELRVSDRKLGDLIEAAEAELSDGDGLRVYVCGKSGEQKSFSIGSGIDIDRDQGFWIV